MKKDVKVVAVLENHGKEWVNIDSMVLLVSSKLKKIKTVFLGAILMTI